MNDAVPMRVPEGVTHLRENGLHQRDRQASDVVNDGIERASLHVLHHEVHDVFALLDRKNGNDMRMAERGRRPRFALEPLHHTLAHQEQGRRKHFDRDFAVEGDIMGQIDRGHAAVA